MVVFSALTLMVGWQEGHPACVVAGFPNPFPDTPISLLVPLCVCLATCVYACIAACLCVHHSVGRLLCCAHGIAPVRLLRTQPVCAGAKDNERLLLCRLTCATCEINWNIVETRAFSASYTSVVTLNGRLYVCWVETFVRADWPDTGGCVHCWTDHSKSATPVNWWTDAVVRSRPGTPRCSTTPSSTSRVPPPWSTRGRTGRHQPCHVAVVTARNRRRERREAASATSRDDVRRCYCSLTASPLPSCVLSPSFAMLQPYVCCVFFIFF